MTDTSTMKSESVGTVRTTVNMTVLTLIATVIARYTNWSVEVEDLLPYTPLIAGVVAIFYRLSLYLAQKFSWIGVILYGINAPPKYTQPAPPLDEGTRIIAPDKGWVRQGALVTALIVLGIICAVVFILVNVDFSTK